MELEGNIIGAQDRGHCFPAYQVLRGSPGFPAGDPGTSPSLHPATGFFESPYLGTRMGNVIPTVHAWCNHDSSRD